MKSKDAVLNMLLKKGSLSSSDIEKTLSITRQAAHHHLGELVKTGRIIKVGRTRGSYYILNEKSALDKALGAGFKKEGKLTGSGMREDEVFNEIQTTSQVFAGLSPNFIKAVQYAFTEMLNNAFEHSGSDKISYLIKRQGHILEFTVKDAGVGVFNNLRTKLHLANDTEAISELLKGKGTTAPDRHSGEGIFFTSKIADKFVLDSFKVSLCIDNIADDVFIRERRRYKGTVVQFMLSTTTDKDLGEIFKEYSNEHFAFDKSRVSIKLFAYGNEYISRSQAKRLLANLDKFNKVILDFKDITTIGQGFADQIFRVFKNEHPGVEIEAVNCSDTVNMMIQHVRDASR